MTYERQVIAYKNYFLDFYEELPDNIQAKIEWTLNLIRVTRQVPEKYFSTWKARKDFMKSELKLEAISIVFSHFSIKEI